MKKIKTIICILSLLFLLFPITAEINPPARFFEVGVSAEPGFVNSYFGLQDIFKEVITIDFNDIANSLSNNSGMELGVSGDVSAFVDINIGKLFGFGVQANVNVDSSISFPKGLFDLIATGNQGTTISGDLQIGGDVVVDVSVPVKGSFQVFGKRGYVFITPSLFCPIVHIGDSEAATFFLGTDEGGNSSVSATVDTEMYTAIRLLGNNKSFNPDISNINPEEFIKNSGIDLGVGVEYPIFSFLDLGIDVYNIPIKQAELKYKTTAAINVSAGLNGAGITTGDSIIRIPTSEELQLQLDDEEANELFSRKMKFGVSAAYRPFNNELIAIKPRMVMKISLDEELTIGSLTSGVFDFGVKVQSKLGILKLAASSNYVDKVWTQRADIALDLRILELDIAASTCGTDFIGSFGLKGLTAGIACKIGF